MQVQCRPVAPELTHSLILSARTIPWTWHIDENFIELLHKWKAIGIHLADDYLGAIIVESVAT